MNVLKLCSLTLIIIVIEYGIDDSKWTKVCSVTNTQLGTKDGVRAQIKKSQGIISRMYIILYQGLIDS